MNIIIQALFDLAAPAALFFFIAMLFVKRVGAPEWIYAVAIPLGIFVGLYNMVKFILSATSALDRLEKQGRNTKAKTDNNKGNKQ